MEGTQPALAPLSGRGEGGSMRGYTEESSGLQDGSETSLPVKESWCGSVEVSEEPHGHSSGWTWEMQSEGRGPGEGLGEGSETHLHVPLPVLLQWEVHRDTICKERGEDRLPGRAFWSPSPAICISEP